MDGIKQVRPLVVFTQFSFGYKETGELVVYKQSVNTIFRMPIYPMLKNMKLIK